MFSLDFFQLYLSCWTNLLSWCKIVWEQLLFYLERLFKCLLKSTSNSLTILILINSNVLFFLFDPHPFIPLCTSQEIRVESISQWCFRFFPKLGVNYIVQVIINIINDTNPNLSFCIHAAIPLLWTYQSLIYLREIHPKSHANSFHENLHHIHTS